MGDEKLELANTAALREYLAKLNRSDYAKEISDRFGEVLDEAKKTNPKMAGVLQKISQYAEERGAPKEDIVKQLLERASQKKNIFSNNLKAVPLVGGLVGLGSAISSGDAAAAIVDQVVPGGVEAAGPQKGSIDEMIEDPDVQKKQIQKQILQKMMSGGIPQIQQLSTGAPTIEEDEDKPKLIKGR